MSIAGTTTTDFLDDITVAVGTDSPYVFSVCPVDLTGTTAQFITSFGTFPVVLSVAYNGDLPTTTFSTGVPNASLPAVGVYTWAIRVTWPGTPSIVLQYGHGAFYVTANGVT